LETAQFQFARRRITYARKFRTIELLISELMLLTFAKMSDNLSRSCISESLYMRQLQPGRGIGRDPITFLRGRLAQLCAHGLA